MKTLTHSLLLLACLLGLAALPVRAGYVYWETFNYYSNGYGVVNQSAGKWMPWRGPATSDDAMVSNAPPLYAGNLRLSQAEAIGTAGFQEVVSFFPNALAYASRARIRMSINYIGGPKNSDFYLWVCSGDATALDTAYADSGPGALIVNWAGPSSGGLIPLHLWNTFGIWKIADVTSGEWHEIQYDIVKSQVGITGGTVGITIDGTYLGAVPFPLQLQDSVISNVVNAFDFYAIDNDLLLVDNIVIEDIPVDITATNFYVSVTGSDANDGTTPATAWRTLGYALGQLDSIGLVLNPNAFVTITQAQPLPTQRWVVINLSTGSFEGEKNIPADIFDIYRLGYINTNVFIRDERLHNFLIIRGAGIGKTFIVDVACSNDAKFKIYSRWVRLEDFTLYGKGMGGGESFFTDPIHFRPVDGLAMDYRVERVQVCPAPGAPPELLGNRAGISFLANWRDCRNKLVRGCLLNNLGIGVKNYNNLSQYPILVEYCTFADLVGAPFSGRGIGVLCEGAGGWVRNCLFVNITTNAPDLTRGIGVNTWGIAAANLKTAFSQVFLVDNNMFNIGQNGINYTSQQANASFIFSKDIYQQPILETVGGLPYRCGAGNIGYMSGLAPVYVSPTAPSDVTLGLTPATAFKTIPPTLTRHSGGVGPTQMATLRLLNGVHSNPVNYVWSGFHMLRVFPPYLDIRGQSVSDTVIFYTNTTVARSGINLSGRGVMLRDLTVQRGDLITSWSWFAGLVESWFGEDVVISNVQVLQPGAGASAQPCIHFYGGNNRRVYHTLCVGGTVGAAANVANVTSYFRNCTFVNNNGSGDASGRAAITMLDAGQYAFAEKCIIHGTTNVARPGTAGATIVVHDSVTNQNTFFQAPGTPGTAIASALFAADPQFQTYQGRQYASKVQGYGWFNLPEEPYPSSWPMAGRNKQRQGWFTNGAPLTVAAILWTNASAYGSSGSTLWGCGLTLGSTATDGNRVFAAVNPVPANANAALIALDAATGTTVWQAVLGGPGVFLNGTPAVGDSLVYIGETLDSGYRGVYGVNRLTGQIVWSNKVDNMNAAAFLVHNGKVYWDTDWQVAGIWCADALTGQILWSNRFAAGNWGTSGMPVSPDGSAIYNHGDDGKLHAVDANNGATLWEAGPYEGGQGNNEPVVDNAGNIYCMFPGISNGHPYAVLFKYSSTGSNLWMYEFPYETDDGGMALSPDGSVLYATIAATTTNSGLYALDPATGTLKWRMDIGRCGGSPVVGAPGNIIIGVYELAGQIVARAVQDNGSSATLLWTIPLGPVHGGWINKSAFVRPCILPNGDVIVQNPAGLIACLTVPEPALGTLALALFLLARRQR
ncbi:MAG: PQQ-like beta-propeller repeat protein [bacterium]|nr:PQQ-like beta-propeller repeat protein [bacterium]